MTGAALSTIFFATVPCQSQLGMEEGSIPDSAITASDTLLNMEFEPALVRLSYPDRHNIMWVDTESWVQVKNTRSCGGLSVSSCVRFQSSLER